MHQPASSHRPAGNSSAAPDLACGRAEPECSAIRSGNGAQAEDHAAAGSLDPRGPPSVGPRIFRPQAGCQAVRRREQGPPHTGAIGGEDAVRCASSIRVRAAVACGGERFGGAARGSVSRERLLDGRPLQTGDRRSGVAMKHREQGPAFGCRWRSLRRAPHSARGDGPYVCAPGRRRGARVRRPRPTSRCMCALLRRNLWRPATG